MIEAANVGRQMFTEADLGQYKAETLARRFNYAMGLSIVWHNALFDPERHTSHHGTLLCGAVDNHQARLALAQADAIWIDSGNHFATGQVIIGNTADPNVVRHGFGERTCSYLPNAALVFPSLLEPETSMEQPLSCAALVEQGDQSLLVNDAMGMIAADYTYRLLAGLPITSFLTYLDTSVGFTARSVLITRDDVFAYLS